MYDTSYPAPAPHLHAESALLSAAEYEALRRRALDMVQFHHGHVCGACGLDSARTFNNACVGQAVEAGCVAFSNGGALVLRLPSIHYHV